MIPAISLIQSRSPHAPADLVAAFPAAGEAGVQAVVLPAQAVQHDWAARNAAARATAPARAADAVEGLGRALYLSARHLSARLDTGLVRVNAPTSSGADFYPPFGGEKGSGYSGREQGEAAQDFFTSCHTVAISPSS